jgi:hypothetical protein
MYFVSPRAPIGIMAKIILDKLFNCDIIPRPSGPTNTAIILNFTTDDTIVMIEENESLVVDLIKSLIVHPLFFLKIIKPKKIYT